MTLDTNNRKGFFFCAWFVSVNEDYSKVYSSDIFFQEAEFCEIQDLVMCTPGQ
jgi:hypothetical protein